MEFENFLSTMKINENQWRHLQDDEVEFTISRFRECGGSIQDVLIYLNKMEVKNASRKHMW